MTGFRSPWRRVRGYWRDVVAFCCTWQHLAARWITVEQSGKIIFLGNAAGAPGNDSYYLSFNDFQNLCIQFVFSSIYLCICIAIYTQEIWTGSMLWLRAIRGVPDYDDGVNSEIHSKAAIERFGRYTLRPWSSEVGDAIGDRDWVNSAMHWEAVIEWVWTCTWRPGSSELSDTLRAEIEQV